MAFHVVQKHPHGGAGSRHVLPHEAIAGHGNGTQFSHNRSGPNCALGVFDKHIGETTHSPQASEQNRETLVIESHNYGAATVVAGYR